MLKPRLSIPAAAAAVALALSFGAPPPAAAQDAPASGAQELRSLVQEYRQVAGQLEQIRQQALTANPDLVGQQKVLQDKVIAAMAESGYDVEANSEKLKALGEELRSGELDAERRKQVIAQLQQEQRKIRAAQETAFQQPEVMEAAQELNNAILLAMREQDPTTDELVARLKALRAKLQSMAGGGADG